MSLDRTIAALHAAALSQLDRASTLEAIEGARVEFLGRKGKLSEISKEFGKLAPEERKSAGARLNAVKQDLEARLEARKAELESHALDARLESEWIDLTAPAPGPHAACKADVQKLCSGVQPGGGRIMACLKEHKDEVSQACRDSFQKMKPAHPDQGDSGKPQ